jgi:hypothetical protein
MSILCDDSVTFQLLQDRDVLSQRFSARIGGSSETLPEQPPTHQSKSAAVNRARQFALITGTS